ncbi:MAG: helix-turn-helix domain-containing protein [Candidatus Dormibacteraceae bacterium]
MSVSAAEDLAGVRLLAAGSGWRVSDIVCRAGPRDRVLDEAHQLTVVAAVVGGTFTYQNDAGTTFLAPGSFLLAEAGGAFRCSHQRPGGDRCVAFHVTPAFVEETATDVPGVTESRFASNRLPPLAARLPLLTEVAAFAGGRDGSGEELALRMVGAALRPEPGGRPAPETVARRDLERVADAVHFIDAECETSVALRDLAERVGLRRYHFLRTFRRVVWETPYRYLLNRRLALAAERLTTTSDRVLDVALASGFGDLSEFTRRFRSRFGLPPAAYRRLHRTYRAGGRR